MKKTLKALKNKFKSLGFSDKAFNAVAKYISDEKNLDEDSDDADIETAISGVEPLLKAFNGDADRRVGTVKTELEKLQERVKKINKGEDVDDDPDAPEETPKGGNPEIAALTKLISGLATTVNGLVEKDKTTTLQSRWEAAAKEKGITNPKLIAKWQPATEADLETALEDLVEFNTGHVVQQSNEQSFGKPPGASGGGGAGSAKKGAAILDAWANSNKPLGTTAATTTDSK